MRTRTFKEETITDPKSEASESPNFVDCVEDVVSVDSCDKHRSGTQSLRTKFHPTTRDREPADINGPASVSFSGVSVQIAAHPHLFDAMFDLSSDPPQWIGRGHVRVCAMDGGVNEVRALVEADGRGTTALRRAGFQIQIASAGEHINRTDEMFGHTHS